VVKVKIWNCKFLNRHRLARQQVLFWHNLFRWNLHSLPKRTVSQTLWRAQWATRDFNYPTIELRQLGVLERRYTGDGKPSLCRPFFIKKKIKKSNIIKKCYLITYQITLYDYIWFFFIKKSPLGDGFWFPKNHLPASWRIC
jgi:hypothetical protein